MEFKILIHAHCKKCDDILEIEQSGDSDIIVKQPCKSCLEYEKEGYEKGYDEGYLEGHRIGYEERKDKFKDWKA